MLYCQFGDWNILEMYGEKKNECHRIPISNLMKYLVILIWMTEHINCLIECYILLTEFNENVEQKKKTCR